MSATLDAEVLSEYLGEAARFRSKGRAFPVTIRHALKEDDRPLPIRVRSALRSFVELSGDVLVFLPGEREIRECTDALSVLSEIDVLPLHGNLPLDQQAKVIFPNSSGKRRVILSTNVAESSLTVPGVTTVIDSGLARIGLFDPWSGIGRLETVTISQARSIQRAGRAGRVEPGEAILLFTKGNFQSRPLADSPEIKRTDLSALLLKVLLHRQRSGVRPEGLRFLTPPDENRWEKARELLERLGAVDAQGLTADGQLMAQLPLSPRFSRIALTAFRLGVGRRGCLATALLSERDIVMDRHQSGSERDVEANDSDLLDRMDRMDQLREARFSERVARELSIDARRSRQIARAADSAFSALSALLGRAPTIPSGADPDELLLRSLLEGLGDRVATRRGHDRSLLLADGTQATLSPSSAVHHAHLLLALSADAPFGKSRKPVVRWAARLDPDWLLDQNPTSVTAVEVFEFNEAKQRVENISQLKYEKLVLDESTGPASPSEGAADVLLRAALAKGPAVFDPDHKLETLGVKLCLLRQYAPDFCQRLSLEEQALIERAADAAHELTLFALRAATRERTTLAELREADLSIELSAALSTELKAALREQTPDLCVLVGGRKARLNYEVGKSPFLSSRLQDFFSMTQTPTILFGRLPLPIHFLAPNQRPLQVTTDLSGFWSRHYPDLRRQLMRRYPKHFWPEDGSTATPPPPRPPMQGRKR